MKPREDAKSKAPKQKKAPWDGEGSLGRPGVWNFVLGRPKVMKRHFLLGYECGPDRSLEGLAVRPARRGYHVRKLLDGYCCHEVLHVVRQNYNTPELSTRLIKVPCCRLRF